MSTFGEDLRNVHVAKSVKPFLAVIGFGLGVWLWQLAKALFLPLIGLR